MCNSSYPGLTCPDYDWSAALDATTEFSAPFLTTVGTEMEALAYLVLLTGKEDDNSGGGKSNKTDAHLLFFLRANRTYLFLEWSLGHFSLMSLHCSDE